MAINGEVNCVLRMVRADRIRKKGVRRGYLMRGFILSQRVDECLFLFCRFGFTKFCDVTCFAVEMPL